mgnify:CR=1 FL=1
MADAEKIVHEAMELHRDGDLDKAAEKYKMAIEQNSLDKRVFTNYAAILRNQGNPEEAAKIASKGIDLCDKKSPILHNTLANALRDLKRYDEAKAAYLSAIALDADYFDAYNNLGSLYLDQAIPLIDKMNNLGLSQADQKKYNSLKSQRNKLYNQAQPYLEEAVRINDSEIQLLKALKDVCYQTDDIECWKKTNDLLKQISK